MATIEFGLQSSGVAIKGKIIAPDGKEPAPVVILCHGIPSGAPVEGDPGYEALAERFVGEGVAACMFNFRGTGESGGDFSLPGWMRDLETVLGAARGAEGAFRRCDPHNIAIMGFSGGGAVSIACAARTGGLRALASLSAPADFSHLITREGIGGFIAHAREIGIIRDPHYPASEEEYYKEMHECRPVEVVARISPTPLLLVHGDVDDTVPVAEARLLYKLRLDPVAMDKAIDWMLERLR